MPGAPPSGHRAAGQMRFAQLLHHIVDNVSLVHRVNERVAARISSSSGAHFLRARAPLQPSFLPNLLCFTKRTLEKDEMNLSLAFEA